MKAFNTAHGEKLLLVSCGILKKEISFLIQKNNWPVESHFLNSSLHIDFEKLSGSLNAALSKYKNRETIVFYGACHPLMERILENSKTIRSQGQNCAEMLLGKTLFNEELSKGAYFLLEDWAHRWDEILEKTFGSNPGVIKEIFRGDRAYLLALRTPCSGNFESGAQHAAKTVGLPLRWRDVSLDQLESVLNCIISTKLGNQ
jgi:hypothetical protein